MTRHDLAYLWAAKGRGGKLYWFYRRSGHRVPIVDENGQRLTPEHYGFLTAYERIHQSFNREEPQGVRPGTLAALIGLYKASPMYSELSQASKTAYRFHLDPLVEKHGTLSIKTVSTEFAEAMRDKMADRPAMANRRVSVLTILLNFAERRKLALGLPNYWRNPLSKIDKLKEGPGFRQWPDNVISAVVATASKEVRWMVQLALYTGQRPGDVLKMLWSDYDGQGIQVVQQKTGAKVWIPAHRDLQALLDEIPKRALVILTTVRGRPWKRANYGEVVRAAVQAAGFKGYTLHGLRKNATTRLLEAGCTTAEVQAITGHATIAMVEHYAKAINQRRMGQSAVTKLEQWKQQK
jgi:integrase